MLAARLGELHVADGLAERAPPHLLVQLGELAGDGDLAQRPARGQQRGQRRAHPAGRLVQHDGPGLGHERGDALAAHAPLRGRKPSNTKRSVGNPESTSAVSTALGPGTTSTASPASRQARTSRSPGSLIPGIPASVT